MNEYEFTLETVLRARIYLEEGEAPIYVRLAYDNTDHHLLHMIFLNADPDGNEVSWHLALSLMEEMVTHRKAGLGDVKLERKQGRVFLHLSSPHGEALVSVRFRELLDYLVKLQQLLEMFPPIEADLDEEYSQLCENLGD